MGCCRLLGHRVQLGRDIGGDRAKIRAHRFAAVGGGRSLWRAEPGIDARRARELGPECACRRGRAVLKSGGREEVHLEEIPAEQRAPILKAYLQHAPGARPHVPVNKEALLAEFDKATAAFPVFRVVSNVHACPRA